MTTATAKRPTAAQRRWDAFRREEERWAKEGSGMTPDQMTGAVMYDLWLNVNWPLNNEAHAEVQEVPVTEPLED